MNDTLQKTRLPTDVVVGETHGCPAAAAAPARWQFHTHAGWGCFRFRRAQQSHRALDDINSPVGGTVVDEIEVEWPAGVVEHLPEERFANGPDYVPGPERNGRPGILPRVSMNASGAAASAQPRMGAPPLVLPILRRTASGRGDWTE
jgi:hypothetical protein